MCLLLGIENKNKEIVIRLKIDVVFIFSGNDPFFSFVL